VSNTTIKTTVDAMKAVYAGCGSHQIDVELTYGSMGGVQTLADELRMEADRLDPRDLKAAIVTASQAIEQVEQIRQAVGAVIKYRYYGDTVLQGAISALNNSMKELDKP
jgi:hypothetical protein